MRLLLDTHIALWAITLNAKLSRKARELIADPGNEVFVSVASLWEVAVKHALKRTGPNAIPISADDAARYFDQSSFNLLDVRKEHVIALEALPLLHGDPFDRLLVAQAASEPLRLLTSDKLILAYGAMTIPA